MLPDSILSTSKHATKFIFQAARSPDLSDRKVMEYFSSTPLIRPSPNTTCIDTKRARNALTLRTLKPMVIFENYLRVIMKFCSGASATENH